MLSLKVGLGMNASMQDGYNLGWKVALAASSVLRDQNALLATYAGERYPAAQKLVAFDTTLFGNDRVMDANDFK